MNKSLMAIAFVISMTMLVNPAMADTLTQTTDRLNFDSSETHNQTVTWVGAAPVTITATHPSSLTFGSAIAGCTNISATQVQCDNIASDSSIWYTLNSPSGASEYTTYVLSATTNTSFDAGNITLVNIPAHEVFYTLVEYGRGRGNYFYATTSKAKGLNLTQSYIPESTDMELNFLHKVINIGRYIGLPGDTATEANWTCVYPDKTVIRQHNIDTMTSSGGAWTVGYNVEEVETSWERMGYLSMQIDSGEYSAGSAVQINCSSIEYAIDSGKVVIDSDDFTLNVVSREPVSVTAYPSSASVTNGTTEVEITYEIENGQAYAVEDVLIEISAPEAATFIGVRGELWGTSEEIYVQELIHLEPSEKYNITLVARFDTDLATDTSLSASEGVEVEFLAPWEREAYNPATYVQDVTVSETITWNQGGAASTITNVIDTIENINSTITTINTLVTEINTTTHGIETTVNTIETLVIEINTTTHNISDDLQVNVIPSLTTIEGYTDQVEGLILDVIDLLDCTNTTANAICDRLLTLNNTVNSIQTDTTQIISDISSLNTTVNNNHATVISRFDAVDGNLTEIDTTLAAMNITIEQIEDNTWEIIDLLDCTNSSASTVCDKLDNITNIVAAIDCNITINGNIDEILNITRYINETRWNNLTANDLYSAIQNIDLSSVINQLNANTTEILKRIRLHKEFSEEMVFLITDSVNSQVAAQKAVGNNDLETAVVELKSAQDSLNHVSDLLVEQRDSIEDTPAGFSMLPQLFVGIAAIGCLIVGTFVSQRKSGRQDAVQT